MIEEETPDHNHAGDNTIKVKNKPGDTLHALYHYDLSSIPTNQKVVTATAWFYVDSEDKEGAVTLHPVTADWTEANLTWDAIGGQFESGVYGSFPPQPARTCGCRSTSPRSPRAGSITLAATTVFC